MKSVIIRATICSVILIVAHSAGAVPVVADFVDADSNLYFTSVTSGSKLFQYDRDSGTFNSFDFQNLVYRGLSLRELAFDNDNNLYLANFDTALGSETSIGILKVRQDGSDVSVLVSQTAAEEAYWGLTLGNDNFLYATDSRGNSIQKFSLDGMLVSSFSDARLLEPRGLAFDTKGNLLVANSAGRNVLVYDSSFNFVREIALTSQVWGISAKPTGSIYVSSGNQGDFINVYDADYNFVKSITNADLTEPAQAAFDQRGFLYSSSTNRSNIVVFDADDAYVETLSDTTGLTLGMAFDRSTAPDFVLPVPEPSFIRLTVLGHYLLVIRARSSRKRATT
jgi:hypothetical protein